LFFKNRLFLKIVMGVSATAQAMILGWLGQGHDFPFSVLVRRGHESFRTVESADLLSIRSGKEK
jgi:hypothetical protein